MTTRNALGGRSEYSRSMAVTAGSTLSATAEPPAISNAMSTIAKRRTSTSPEEPSAELQTAQGAAKATPAARQALASISAKRDLFASLPAHRPTLIRFRHHQADQTSAGPCLVGEGSRPSLPFDRFIINAVALPPYGKPALARPSAMR